MKIVTGPVIATTGEAAATKSGSILRLVALPKSVALWATVETLFERLPPPALHGVALFLQPTLICLILDYTFYLGLHSCASSCDDSCDDNCGPSSCDEEVNKIRRLPYPRDARLNVGSIDRLLSSFK
jgi:hypothetical protein